MLTQEITEAILLVATPEVLDLQEAQEVILVDTTQQTEDLHVAIILEEDLQEVQEDITHVALQEVQTDTLEVIELQVIPEVLVVAVIIQEVIVEVIKQADTNLPKQQQIDLQEVLEVILLQQEVEAQEAIQLHREVLVVTLHHQEVALLAEVILVVEVAQEVADVDKFNQPYLNKFLN